MKFLLSLYFDLASETGKNEVTLDVYNLSKYKYWVVTIVVVQIKCYAYGYALCYNYKIILVERHL